MWLWKKRPSKQALSDAEAVQVRSLALQFALSYYNEESTPERVVATARRYKDFLVGKEWDGKVTGHAVAAVERPKLVIEERDK